MTTTTPKACPAVQSVLENPLEPLSLAPSISFEEALRVIQEWPVDPAIREAEERRLNDPFTKLKAFQRHMLYLEMDAQEMLNHPMEGVRLQSMDMLRAFTQKLAQICADEVEP